MWGKRLVIKRCNEFNLHLTWLSITACVWMVISPWPQLLLLLLLLLRRWQERRCLWRRHRHCRRRHERALHRSRRRRGSRYPSSGSDASFRISKGHVGWGGRSRVVDWPKKVSRGRKGWMGRRVVGGSARRGPARPRQGRRWMRRRGQGAQGVTVRVWFRSVRVLPNIVYRDAFQYMVKQQVQKTW